MDFSFVVGNIAGALPMTLFITFVSFGIGFLLAFLLTLVRIRRFRVWTRLAALLISFLRGTPLLIQMFIVYYGIPFALEQAGLDIGSWDIIVFPIVAMALNCSAYLSEIMRSAYLGVNKGEIEAALSIGMSSFQTLRRVIFPQAFKIALPNLGNLLIDLLKDSSLVFSIGIVDIMGKAKNLSAASYGVYQMQSFVAVSLIYWALCMVIEKSIAVFESRLGRGKKAVGSESAAK